METNCYIYLYNYSFMEIIVAECKTFSSDVQQTRHRNYSNCTERNILGIELFHARSKVKAVKLERGQAVRILICFTLFQIPSQSLLSKTFCKTTRIRGKL